MSSRCNAVWLLVGIDEIGDCGIRSKIFEIEYLWSHEIAKVKFAYEAMVKTLVLVGNLEISANVRMQAMLFRIRMQHVLERMHRLKHNRRQYCREQCKVQYRQPLFHQCKSTARNVKISLTFCETEIKSRFVKM